MSYLTSFLFILAFVSTCTTPAKISLAMADQIIEYQVNDNEFVVIIVETEGVSKSQAKKFAYQRAAELAFENGYRYITIESESQTFVLDTGDQYQDSFPQNLYQEQIMEGGFGRQERTKASENGLVPAYRVSFKAYDEKPSWKSIDVCTLTHCN